MGGGGGGGDSAPQNPMAAMMAAMGGGGGGGGCMDQNPMAAMMRMRMAMGGGTPIPGSNEVCRFWAKAGWCKFGEKCNFNHFGPANPKGKPPDQQVLGEYMGVIKSYNPEKGFGFIACDTLKGEYEGDVFLSQKHVGDYQVGAEVRFTAYLFGGKLQCKDLVDATGQVGPQQGAGKPGTVAGDQDLGTFTGMIKSYNTEKGFGFIESPDLSTKGYDMDAFLHKDHIGDFQPGSIITFTAFLRDSKLRARNLSYAVEREAEPKPSVFGALGGSAALDAIMFGGGPDDMDGKGSKGGKEKGLMGMMKGKGKAMGKGDMGGDEEPPTKKWKMDWSASTAGW